MSINMPPLLIGFGEVISTFICAMPPGGAVSLDTLMVFGATCAAALVQAATAMQNQLNPLVVFITFQLGATALTLGGEDVKEL
jgi:hypothetical protein